MLNCATIADPAAGRATDVVDRKFGGMAPHVLLVADFTRMGESDSEVSRIGAGLDTEIEAWRTRSLAT